MDCFVDSIHAHGMPVTPPSYEVHPDAPQFNKAFSSRRRKESNKVVNCLCVT